MVNPVFKLVLMEDAREFLQELPETVQNKISYNINKVRSGYYDSELFKKLEGSDIWEFRTLYGGNIYRLFAFWDTQTDALVVATHGFMKKTQRTPRKEIAKAEEIRRRYFDYKRRKR